MDAKSTAVGTIQICCAIRDRIVMDKQDPSRRTCSILSALITPNSTGRVFGGLSMTQCDGWREMESYGEAAYMMTSSYGMGKCVCVCDRDLF